MENTKQSKKLVRVWDTSCASNAAYDFEKTGERTSPYLAYPERESFQTFRIYERPDGTQFRTRQAMHRWGAEFSFGSEKVMIDAE